MQAAIEKPQQQGREVAGAAMSAEGGLTESPVPEFWVEVDSEEALALLLLATPSNPT